MSSRCVLASTALLLTGCGDRELELSGPHYHYVVSELHIPTNNTTVHMYGLDLNDDGRVDNQLGDVFNLLEGNGLGVASTAQEALLRGGAILLADFQTATFDATELSGLTTYLGSDPTPAPCLDPALLETCGQHLHGDGQFSIEPGSESDQAQGPIQANVFAARMGLLPLEIAIDADAPIRLDLQAARVLFSTVSEGHLTGVLAGMIIEADVDGVLVPQIAVQMERIVGAECGLPTGTMPCGCIRGERADLLQSYFDANDDCEITLDEVRVNSIVQSLLASDVTISGRQGLSFGLGVELVPAAF